MITHREERGARAFIPWEALILNFSCTGGALFGREPLILEEAQFRGFTVVTYFDYY